MGILSLNVEKQDNSLSKSTHLIPINCDNTFAPSDYIGSYTSKDMVELVEENSNIFNINILNADFFNYATLRQVLILKILLKNLNDQKAIITRDLIGHKIMTLDKIYAIGAGSYKLPDRDITLNKVIIELLSGKIIELLAVNSDVFTVCPVPSLISNFKICLSITPKPVEVKEETQKPLISEDNFVDTYLNVLTEISDGIDIKINKERLGLVEPAKMRIFIKTFKFLKNEGCAKSLYLFKLKGKRHIFFVKKKSENKYCVVTGIYKDTPVFEKHLYSPLSDDNQIIIEVNF